MAARGRLTMGEPEGAMRKRKRATYAQVLAELDEAIADRDFVIGLLRDLGAAVARDDVAAVAIQLLGLRASVRLTGASHAAARRWL